MTTTVPGRDLLAWEWLEHVDEHRDALAAMLAASVDDDGILGYARPPTPTEADGFVAGLARACAEGSGHVLTGREGDGAVSAMVFMSISSMPNCAHLAEVSKAYVSPRVRGGRVVFELAGHVAARAAEHGVETLVIDVREDSKAHRVWSRMGFETFGVLPDYSRVGGVSHRGHYMRCSVPALAELVTGRLRS